MDDRKRRIEDLENYENYKSLVRKVGQSIKQIPLIPCLFTLRTLVSQAELASEHKEGTELNKIEIGILNQAKDIAQASYTILNDAEKFDFVKNYEEIKQRLDIKFYQGN